MDASGMPLGPADTSPGHRQTFHQAADAFCALVARVPSTAWEQPGLGSWDVRSLVGHACRSLLTVVDYLGQPSGEPSELADAAAYVVAAARFADPSGQESIRQRGVQAGAQLGDDPASTVAGWRDQALLVLQATSDEVVVPTVMGRMRVCDYLPTRSFELTVHGLDIAAAVGLPPDWPAEPLREALSLTSEVAVRAGTGVTLLHAVTGRFQLPRGFTVVP